MPAVATHLKAIRESKMLTQGELAERAEVHLQTVYRIERGSPAEFKTIRKLARALGVEPAELVDS